MSIGETYADGAVIQFRNYRVLPQARKLLCEGQPVALSGPAFDLLTVLLRARGTIVPKDHLLSYVWPSRVVEESNLRVQILTLRKALGMDRDLIKTIPGRGYLFIAEPNSGMFVTSPLINDASNATSIVRCNTVWIASKTSEARRTDVVVIDRDHAVREAIHSLLRSTGLRVERFASVQEFLAAGWAEPPRCLVLDAWMPGKSGLDFQADLASANLHIPIVFVSNQVDIHMCVRAMKAGAIEFLTKPVQYRDLLGAIEQAFATTMTAKGRC
ncbi:response regulator (plasmid) [Microvirga terrae]|uniref:Response regulator n=1 Tax=Microvirga terrae TaxID=2740529 RepID=A0ABY5RZA7_9HYPH|nr:response regulator [Microvirga terrae]UVF22593.1 response regulator [Microvirga terrae]